MLDPTEPKFQPSPLNYGVVAFNWLRTLQSSGKTFTVSAVTIVTLLGYLRYVMPSYLPDATSDPELAQALNTIIVVGQQVWGDVVYKLVPAILFVATLFGAGTNVQKNWDKLFPPKKR